MQVVTKEMLEAVASRAYAPRQEARNQGAAGERIPAGRRNIALTSLAGTMRRRGFSEEAMAAALLVENEDRCEPPLGEDEVRRIARSVARYEPAGDDHGDHPIAGGVLAEPEGAVVAELPPAPPFPLAALPASMRLLVEEATAAIGCPPEFVALPMLATLGAAVGNARVLELKGGWAEGAGLYVAVVADPGAKKTPAQKVATRPAWWSQAELKREYDEAMAGYLREKREWEAEKRRASAEGRPAPEPPQEPTMARTVVEDTTVEALVVRLEENPRRLLVTKDELTGWVRGLDQYKGGRGADRQFYLSAWSQSAVAVDRKARKDPQMIPRPFLCLAGSIQPGVLSELKNHREDGLLDRFLFGYPNPVTSRWSDAEIGQRAAALYRELYERLRSLEMDADENWEPAPRRLRFTDDAKELFVREADSLREEMESPGFPARLKGPWSKLEAYLARLSLILALARMAEEDLLAVPAEEVAEPDVRAAAELVAYFKAHARRVHARLHGEGPERLLAEALAGFLLEEGGAWEGQPSELYGILKARSAPGLPGGEGPFGKRLREAARENVGLSLEEGWRGNVFTVRVALSTPGTPGIRLAGRFHRGYRG